MNPFLGTRGRLRCAAASLLVIFAAELLKWQNPVAGASDMLRFLTLGTRKVIANQETSLFTH